MPASSEPSRLASQEFDSYHKTGWSDRVIDTRESSVTATNDPRLYGAVVLVRKRF